MSMPLLDKYFGLQDKIYQYFGYVEDWKVIPLEDRTQYYWALSAEGPGYVRYARDEKELFAENSEELYEDLIYTQRFLPKWVYRGEAFTMVCADTQVDLNKFLAIYDNSKERPWPTGVESSWDKITREIAANQKRIALENASQNAFQHMPGLPTSFKTEFIPLPAFLQRNRRPFD